MTTPTPAGWYQNPDGAPGLRYWDGSAWTDHLAVGTPQPPIVHRIRPGLPWVWITAILSLFHFSIGYGDVNEWTTIAFPVGLVAMAVCWLLVRSSAADAAAHGMPLPTGYKAARITAGVLGAISVLNSILITFG